jgi:hypothetical protein
MRSALMKLEPVSNFCKSDTLTALGQDIENTKDPIEHLNVVDVCPFTHTVDLQ